MHESSPGDEPSTGRGVLCGPVGDDLGQWLRDLAERVAMPSWVAGTVGDVGRRLRPAVVDDTHPGVRLLHNLDRPLLEQLDPGSVTELRLVEWVHRNGTVALWAVPT